MAGGVRDHWLTLPCAPGEASSYLEREFGERLTAAGYAILDRDAQALQLVARYRPRWAIVLAIVAFPVGLLALLIRRGGMVLLTFSPTGEKTAVAILARERLARRTLTVLSAPADAGQSLLAALAPALGLGGAIALVGWIVLAALAPTSFLFITGLVAVAMLASAAGGVFSAKLTRATTERSLVAGTLAALAGTLVVYAVFVVIVVALCTSGKCD